MHTVNSSLIKSLALVAGFAPIVALALSVGKDAPDFTLPSSQGDEVSLSDFVGKTVVLEWTNHKCPFVVKHYRSDNMQDQQRAAAADEVVWLSIISSAPGKQGHVSADEANAIAKKNKAAQHRILIDESGDVGRAFDAKVTPHMYIIDPEGELVYNGAIDSIDSADREDIPEADQYVSLALAAMAAGEDIKTPTTVPYGCSVKY